MYEPALARTLNNLGIVQGRLGDSSDAIRPTRHAADIYRDLAVRDPEALSQLAATLNNLGTYLADPGEGDKDEALAHTQEAVSLYRQLASDNPAFLTAFVDTLGNLSIRLREAGQSAESDAVLRELQTYTTGHTGSGTYDVR